MGFGPGGIKILLIAVAAVAVLGAGGAGTYFFVIVPRENPLAEYYVSSDPSGVLVMHIVQNNSKFSGTLNALLPIAGSNAQLGGSYGRLFDAQGHALGGRPCGDLCAVEYSISLHGQLSGSKLAMDISTAAGLFSQTVTCVFTVRANSLTAAPDDPCGQQAGSQDPLVTATGAHLVASSEQGATDARSAFFSTFPATIKAFQLWDAAQSLQKQDYSHLADGLTTVVNNFVTAAASDACLAANYYKLDWIGSAVRDIKTYITAAAGNIKNVEALRTAFKNLAKTDHGANWYMQNTTLMSTVDTQLKSSIAQIDQDVTAANKAIVLANSTAPSVFNTAQVAQCVAADLIFHAELEIGAELLTGLLAAAA